MVTAVSTKAFVAVPHPAESRIVPDTFLIASPPPVADRPHWQFAEL